jgi:hypothetical protein
MKRAATFLVPDPNTPGLQVCGDTCVDIYDPWRLAPRTTEDITVKGVRPEVSVANNNVYTITYSPLAGSYTVGETLLGVQSRFQCTFNAVAGSNLTYTDGTGLGFQVGEIILGLTSGATGKCTSTIGQN